MPKFGGHIVIGEAVAKKLGKDDEWLAGEEGAALRLGAVGPDLTLFLMDPAEDNEFVYTALGTGMGVYKDIRRIADKVDELTDYIGEPATELTSWFTGGFSDSLLEFTGYAVQSFAAALKLVLFSKTTISVENPFKDMPTETLLKVFGADYLKWASVPKVDLQTNFDSSSVTSPAYIFRYFGAPYTEDPPFKKKAGVGNYSEWWWMDILHYRRSALFARSMLEAANASKDPVLMAYATGYYSHVGGDIVGHPYINSMVGGPFRNHALRHMVIESLLDVEIWRDRKGEEIINSRLDKKVDLSKEAIEKIARLLSDSMKSVYANPPMGQEKIVTKHFGETAPSADDLIKAYNTMSGYLAFSTDIGLEPPKKPPGNLGEVWEKVRQHLQTSIDKIGGYAHDLGTVSGWEWLAALIGLVMWCAVLVIEILTLPFAITAAIIAVGPEWIIYLVNSALYDFIRNVRYTMALCGWGYAGQKDLDRPMSRELLTVRSTLEGDNLVYPYAMTNRVDAYWLYYPTARELGGTLLEMPRTISGPYNRNHKASDFIDGLPFDVTNEADLKSLHAPKLPAAPNTINEAWSTGVLANMLRTTPTTAFFGNAVDFTVMLIKGDYPDGSFDLDGDRGYASTQSQGYPPSTEYIS